MNYRRIVDNALHKVRRLKGASHTKTKKKSAREEEWKNRKKELLKEGEEHYKKIKKIHKETLQQYIILLQLLKKDLPEKREAIQQRIENIKKELQKDGVKR